jgi:hypothetical protein
VSRVLNDMKRLNGKYSKKLMLFCSLQTNASVIVVMIRIRWLLFIRVAVLLEFKYSRSLLCFIYMKSSSVYLDIYGRSLGFE